MSEGEQQEEEEGRGFLFLVLEEGGGGGVGKKKEKRKESIEDVNWQEDLQRTGLALCVGVEYKQMPFVFNVTVEHRVESRIDIWLAELVRPTAQRFVSLSSSSRHRRVAYKKREPRK